MSVTNTPLTLKAGDHRVLRFAVTDGDNNDDVLDLTGLIVKWGLAKRPGTAQAFATPIVSKASNSGSDIVITPVSGLVDVVLNTADTLGKSGDYEQQLTLVDSFGEEYIVATGKVTLIPTVSVA